MNQPNQQGNSEAPKSPGILLFMYLLMRNLPGWFYYQLGRYRTGIASCNRVIAGHSNPGSLNTRGLCYLKLEDWQAAYADFDRALALWPSVHPMLFNNRGYAAYKLGRYEEALTDLDRSLAIQPALRRAIVNRVLVYTDMHRNEDALRDCNRLFAMHPTDADLIRRSAIYIQMEQYDEAVADCTQVLKLKPKYHHFALYNIACARSLQGELGTALTVLRQAIEADSSFRDAAWKDPDLVALREEPEFRALVGDSQEVET